MKTFTSNANSRRGIVETDYTIEYRFYKPRLEKVFSAVVAVLLVLVIAGVIFAVTHANEIAWMIRGY